MNPSPNPLPGGEGEKLRKIYSLKQRWLTGWLPFLIMTALIIKGSVMPPRDIPSLLIEINDKLVHAVEFFLMMLVAYRAFERAASEILYKYRWADAILYSLFLAALTECLQFLTPGRSPEFMDFLADCGGVIIAAALTRKVVKQRV